MAQIIKEYKVKEMYDNNILVETIKYYKNNKVEQIYYYDNGIIALKVFSVNNQLHNENGPGKISYYENGNIEYEFYYLNGKFHNKNSPAVIWYYKTGKVKKKVYYLNGVMYTKKEFDQEIKKLNNTNKVSQNNCENKIVEIDGKKYKLTLV